MSILEAQGNKILQLSEEVARLRRENALLRQGKSPNENTKPYINFDALEEADIQEVIRGEKLSTSLRTTTEMHDLVSTVFPTASLNTAYSTLLIFGMKWIRENKDNEELTAIAYEIKNNLELAFYEC